MQFVTVVADLYEELAKERDGWRLVVRDACSTMGLQESDVDVSGASLFAMSISEGTAARKQRDGQNTMLSRLREACFRFFKKGE